MLEPSKSPVRSFPELLGVAQRIRAGVATRPRFRACNRVSEPEAGVFVLELRHAAAGVHQFGLLAGPGRVR